MHRAFIATLLVATMALPATSQTAGPPSSVWTGTWRGTLTNVPTRPNAATVEVTREIGRMPTADSSCATLRTTYRQDGVERGVKDYRLCRGLGATDWLVDEGDGVKLAAQWLGDVLVSPFKYDSLLLVAQTRVRGDVMEEEILTVDDRPAVKGVLSLRARSIQRLQLRRVVAP